MNNNFKQLRNRRIEILYEGDTQSSDSNFEIEDYPSNNSLTLEESNISDIPDQETGNSRNLEQQLRKSINDTTHLIQELNSLLDDNMPLPQEPSYNKDMAELMSKNIPKFELSSNTNAAMQLRSFLKACENILSLFPDLPQVKKEFFNLIKFRLGYDVQERVTKKEFTTLKELEDHLRSICHIKLNREQLLTKIRNERQNHIEDVSTFVERLRKLIAQGRSEYPDDKEFGKEAIRTLKQGVKNELIGIKLLDCSSNEFDELADIAITRDSELNQRNNNKKNDISSSNDLISELLEKMKALEAGQNATVQHIRETRYRPNSPNRFRSPSRSPNRSEKNCHLCKKPGHFMADCYKRKNFTAQDHQNDRSQNVMWQQQVSPYTDNQHYNQKFPNQYFVPPNFNYNTQFHHEMLSQQNFPGRFIQNCIRCSQPGHQANNCYALLCSLCKQTGHTSQDCKQQVRRVQFLQCANCNECYQHNENLQKCPSPAPSQGN